MVIGKEGRRLSCYTTWCLMTPINISWGRAEDLHARSPKTSTWLAPRTKKDAVEWEYGIMLMSIANKCLHLGFSAEWSDGVLEQGSHAAAGEVPVHTTGTSTSGFLLFVYLPYRRSSLSFDRLL
jgi:hypothetical protein